MVDHFSSDGTSGLARKFHDYIQSQSQTKNSNMVPVLSVSIYNIIVYHIILMQ